MTDFIPVKQSKDDLRREFDCIKQIDNYNQRWEYGGVSLGLLTASAFTACMYLFTPTKVLVTVKAIFSMLTLLGWVVAIPIVIYLIVKRQRWSRRINKAVDEVLESGKSYELRFDDGALTLRTEDVTTEMNWSHFIAYMETPTILFLFTKEWAYSFMAFSTTEIGVENVEGMKTIVRQKLPLLNERIKLRDRV